VGYDDENGGLLRLRGKVSEKEKVLWFSYRDSWRKWKFAFTVWKLFQTLLFLLLPTPAPSMEKTDRCRTATIILTVYFSLLLPHILLWIKQQYNIKQFMKTMLPSYMIPLTNSFSERPGAQNKVNFYNMSHDSTFYLINMTFTTFNHKVYLIECLSDYYYYY